MNKNNENHYYRYHKKKRDNRYLYTKEVDSVSKVHREAVSRIYAGPIHVRIVPLNWDYDQYIKYLNPLTSSLFLSFQLLLARLFTGLNVPGLNSTLEVRTDNLRDIGKKIAFNIGFEMIGRELCERPASGVITTSHNTNPGTGIHAFDEGITWSSNFLEILGLSSYIEYRPLLEHHMIEVIKSIKRSFNYTYGSLAISIEQLHGMLFVKFSSEGFPGIVARIILAKGKCVVFLPFAEGAIKVVFTTYLFDHNLITDRTFHDAPLYEEEGQPNYVIDHMKHNYAGFTWNMVISRLSKQEIKRHSHLRNDYKIPRTQPIMLHVLSEDTNYIHISNEDFMEGAAECSHITGSNHIYLDSYVNAVEYNPDNNPDYSPDYDPENIPTDNPEFFDLDN